MANMHMNMSMTHSSMMHNMTGSTAPMPGHNHGGMDGMGGGMGGMGGGMGGMDGGMNHDMHMNNSGGSHMMMMKMYFHTGIMEYILFEQLMTRNAGEMVGACIVVFILAVIYEGLKVFREKLLKAALNPSLKYREVTITSHTSQDNIIVDPKANGNQSTGVMRGYSDYSLRDSPRVSMISSAHLIQTVLHVLQVFLSYCLMLIFMTYNVWLCIAVVLGAGAGYFFFGWKRATVVDVNDHCH